MAEYADREHYIPIRKNDLVDFLCADAGPTGAEFLPAADQLQFRRLSALVTAHYHQRYHHELEQLKDSYAPFDPDSDTLAIREVDAAQRQHSQDELFSHFIGLLEKANYRHLTREEFDALTTGVSEWGINMDVDFAAFERCELFVRGNTLGTRLRRHKFKPWKAPDEVKVPVFLRLVVIMKQKQHKRLAKDVDTKNVYLKVFKDIPQMDMEMLLPGAQLKMPGFDRLKLGGSLVSAIGYIGWYLFRAAEKLTTAIYGVLAGTATAGIGLLGPLGVIFGYGYKQWAGFQQTKQAYAFKLSQSLYYQNLDSNQGVIVRLLDEAEEQECREALLAYFYLWRYAGTEGWSAENLDEYIEIDLERRLNVKVDFEIEDGLQKLVKLNLLEEAHGRYRVVPISQAIEAMNVKWERSFEKASEAAVPEALTAS